MVHLDENLCQDDSRVTASVLCSAMTCVFQAVLAVIIVVNLQGILAQFKDVCVLWKADRLDMVSTQTDPLTHSCWYHYLLEDYHSLSVLLHSLTLTLPYPYFTPDACAFWYCYAACVLRLAQSSNSDWLLSVAQCWTA